MTYFVYSIRDLKSCYGSPFVAENDQFARRHFENLVQTGTNVLHTHKQDFRLVKIGSFDSELGLISPVDMTVICEGADIIV